LCFTCLTEKVSEGGALPTFNLKQKPVHASCAICDVETSGPELRPSPWGFICNKCCDLCETQTGVSWDLVKISAQKEWLVKSNGKIQGPYTSDEVESNLRSNIIVTHDEISRPLGRWKLLRDEEQFRLVINEIRNKQSSKSEIDQEITDSGTITDADGVTMPIDLTLDRSFTSSEILLKGVEEQSEREVESAPTQNSRDILKSYASKDDQRVQKELKMTNQGRLWIALGILIIASVFALLKLTNTQIGGQSARNESFQELMQSGLKAEKVGDYSKAYDYFSEARTLRPNDSEMLLHLAPLTLFNYREQMQAQRMFKEILENERGINYQKTAYLGIGLIALLSHELAVAKENFNNALKLDVDFVAAHANLGIVYYFEDQLDLARNSLFTAMNKKRGGIDGAVQVSLADVMIAISEKENGENKTKLLKSTHEGLSAYLSYNQDYQQEVLVKDALILYLLSDKKSASDRIHEFLDIDPEKTELHIHDWGLFQERASWGVLVENVKKIVSEVSPSPRLSAALGLAMYRSGEKIDGRQSIEQALAQSPQDPLLMALLGWVQIKLGNRDLGIVNIKQAAQVAQQKVKLPFILQARLCVEEKDYACAKKNWDQVLLIDKNSIEAYHGMGQIEWNKKNLDGALTWVKQGLAFDSTYIPLLKLSQEIQLSQAGGE